MRLAEDDRGRVPFALVGVLLLVGSASYAATLAHQPAPASRPDSVAAMNRVDGTIATAVHRGTKRAAREAAGAPLGEPADTPGGRVLDENHTFRDYLRVRVYHAVREDLASSSVVVGAARADPSLPDTPGAAALRAAKRRVELTRVKGGIRVRIENVTVRLRRGGRVVERHNRTVERTVETPVLAVHERVQRYERRLNRGPTEGPGLGLRMTARINAIAWTRGYAQYGGAPISDVVTNRHIELMANGALLAAQRKVFGRSDPAGRKATAQATAIVGGTDVLMAGQEIADTVQAVPSKPGRPEPASPPKLPEPARPPAAATGNVTVDVDLTADRTFASFVAGRGDTTLDGVVGDVYAADVTVVGASRPVASSVEPRDRPGGANWTVADERTTRTLDVRPTTADGPAPPVEAGWHRLRTDTVQVDVTETTVVRWVRGTGRSREINTTTGQLTRTLEVTVALAGRHATSEYVPARGIDLVHERGGPLDGPNLRGVPAAARERVERRHGTTTELARKFVEDDFENGTVGVAGERPDGLDAWLYGDLAALRDRISDLSVTVDRRRLGAGQVNPAAELAARLRERRASLVDAPGTYGSVAEKARGAARSAYLAVVVDRLERRAGEARKTRTEFDETLVDAGVDPGTLAASLRVGGTAERPPVHPAVTGGPRGSLNASVSGAPPYLTLSGVTHERVRAVPAGERYHPLVARNTNLFTVPYNDVADGVVGHLFGGEERTNLRTAARTLRSANRTLEREHDPDLAHRRDELQAAVARSLLHVRSQLRRSLAAMHGLSPRERAAAVRAGVRRWETTDARALAATNGSLAPAVAAEATARLDEDDDRRDDWLELRLRVALARAREDRQARPEQRSVNRSASVTRTVTKEVVGTALSRGTSAAADAVERKLDGKLARPPAGLPLAPAPGYWYVTTNVWTVTVRGEYARFAVSVPSGRPGRQLTYERERSAVTLDWDDDGDAERLGRSTRVSFDVSTAVMVVVPPGGPGVGDRTGDADERSAGWPRPGNATRGVIITSTPGL